MQLNKSEIEAISKLEPFKRYQYSIKKIADNEALFTLINESGEYALSDIEGKTLLAFWSSSELAINCKSGNWMKYEPKEMSLDVFEDELAEFIDQNNYLIDIFPVNNKTGFVVSLDEFMRDLNEELENYK